MAITTIPYRQQYGAVYDLISEGPIEGLVNSEASVYLNETPITNSSAVEIYGSRLITVSASASSANITGTFLSTDVGKNINIPGAEAASTTSTSLAAGSTALTTSSSIFNAAYIEASARGASAAYVRIAGAGPDGKEYRGRIYKVNSGTSVLMTPATSTAVSSGAAVTVDFVASISNVTSSTTATVSRVVPRTATSVRGQIYAAQVVTGDYYKNFSNAKVFFRPGNTYQNPITSIAWAPTDSFIVADGSELKWYDKDTVNEVIINPLDSQGLGLTRERSQEISNVKLTLEFPAGLLIAQKDGDITQGVAEFQVFIDYKRTASDTAYESFLVYGRLNPPPWPGGNRRITGIFEDDYRLGQEGVIRTISTRSSFVTEIDLNISDYAPFYEWRLRIRRRTPEDPKDFVGSDNLNDGYNFIGVTRLKTIQASTQNIFSYPNSAYAAVEFSAEDFDTPPNRSYHIRGKKVKVPTNYITREEAGTNEAKYTRNKTTGVDTGSYVTWDGTFRGDLSLAASSVNYPLVYTNNPAWIFYDILTNKNYGIGDFVEESDIDKYSLYQIARYCDELVDDGNGGLEPRFTCNVYFSTKQEAYKVLKDLASVFRGMMYWVDGQITPVQDRPKEPVYTFTQGNVIDGLFSYETTGQRARINQVNVTWNNPEELYKQSVVTVDDIDNIAETGRIVAKDVVAFGCTSEGQALRVGRWHLLTDTLETEIVKFQTSINAGFLRPGDVINIQDAKLNSVQFSGRTSNGSTTTSIELDRNVVLQAGETYNLYLIYPEPGCYLQQASATINNTSYERGDLVLLDAGGSAIETAEDAANLVDDSGNKVYTSFNPNSRLEKKEITTGATEGEGTKVLTVSSAFSSAPGTEVIWAVSNINEYQREDAVVRYRILGITEDQKNLFSIVGSKVIFEKYDEIEKNYARYVEQYKPTPSRNETVPSPSELKVELLPTASPEEGTAGVGQKVVVSWNEPVETFTDSNGDSTTRKYQFIDTYEIQHNFKGTGYDGGFETIPIPASQNSAIFDNVTAGNYTVKLRTRNIQGQRSPWISVTQLVKATEQTAAYFDRVTRAILGGSINSPITLNTGTGLVSIVNSDYKFVSSVGRSYTVTSATTAQSEIAFSALSSGQSAYWYFDYSDTVDPWKTAVIHVDSVVESISGGTIDYQYWKELGASNNGLTLISGTVSAASGSATVTGVGTSFTTDFAEGDLIKLSPNGSYTEVAGAEYSEVASVESDTVLHLRGNLTKTFSSNYAYKQSFKPDFVNDNVLAEVTNSAGTFSIEYYVLKSGDQGEPGVNSRTVNLTTSDQSVEYSSAGINPDPSSVTITATALNTEGTPYYEFLEVGTETPVQNSTNSEYSYTSPPNYTSLPQTIEVRLREGSSTSSILARDQITIFGIRPAQSAISAVLSNEAHVLFETEDGTVDFTGSGTSIEVFEGNTQLSYDGTASPANGTFKVTAVGTNITLETSGSPSTSGDARVYADHTAISGNTGYVTYTITATRADGTTETITRTQSLTKVQEGAAARNVTLTVDKQSISYNTNGASPNPSSITFTATARNMQDTAYYEFFVNDDTDPAQASSTTNTYGYTVPTLFTSLPVQVRVDVREGSASGTVIAQDFVTVIGTKPGENAITIILTNEAHTLPTTNTGAVTYAGSGTDIQVYEGNTQLTVDQSLPYSTGTFRVSAVGSGITVGTESEPDINTVRYGDDRVMTADIASVTYTIDVVKADGTTATFTRVQSLSKAFQGEKGGDGDPGLRTVQGYLYYEKTTSGAPDAPTETTYTFATGDIDGGSGANEVLGLADTSAVDKWTNEPRTQDATSSNTYYTIRYSGTEAAANSSTVEVTYSNVVQFTSFEGVVTFTNGTSVSDGTNTLSFGETGTTTIDGGNITTGQISADRIDVAGVITANSILTTSATIENDIKIGSGESVFKADSNGIYLGNETFANAEFRVTPAGAVTATSATISGAITATSLVLNAGVQIGAGNIAYDDVTLTNSGGNLVIKGGGVDTVQLADEAVTGTKIDVSSYIKAGSGSNAAVMSGRPIDNFAFWAGAGFATDGGPSGGTAPFRVTRAGKVVMTSFALYSSAGTKLFDSEQGLLALPQTTVAQSSGTLVDLVSEELTSGTDTFTVTLSATQTITANFAYPVGSLFWSGTSISDSLSKISTAFTVTLQYSANGGSSWNTFGSAQSFSRVISGTPTPSQFLVIGNEYNIGPIIPGEPDSTIYFAALQDDQGAIDEGFTLLGSTSQSLAAGTYLIRMVFSATGGTGTGAPATDKTREVRLTTSGTGFTVSNTTVSDVVAGAATTTWVTDNFVAKDSGGNATVTGALSAQYFTSFGGQELILTAGESKGQLEGVTGGNPLQNEYVYAVAESGLQIISSPNNWIDGGDSYNDVTWASRNTATICKTDGQSDFPAQINVTSHGNSSQWNTAYGWGNHADAGYLTGNQTITLTGDATGSGTTSIAVTVANDSHTHDTRYFTETESDNRFHPIGSPVFSGDSSTADDITSRIESGFYETNTASTGEGYPAGVGDSWAHLLSITHSNDSNYYALQLSASFFTQDLYYRSTNNNGATAWSRIWTDTNDGSGSGLDADLLDGKNHTNFGATLATYGTTGGASGRIRCTAPFNTNSGKMFQVTISLYNSYTIHNYIVSGYMYSTINQWYLPKAIYTGDGTPDIIVGRDSNGKAYISIANGDYTGVRVHNMTRGYTTSVADTYDPWTITVDAGTENSVTPTISKVWHSTNDGSGSGLDADKVDGVEAASFLRSDADDNFSGKLTATGTATNTALDLATNDQYASMRVIRNYGSSTNDGMYIGYGNAGTGVTRIYGGGSTSSKVQVSSDGSLTADGNVTAYSDERLKKDIATLDGSKVFEMRGVSFTKDGKKGSGVIAQELEKVAPELVMDGEFKSVAYGNLVGYLIEAIKDLKAEIDELKNG